jgi:uncharacterized membrane protein YqjE
MIMPVLMMMLMEVLMMMLMEVLVMMLMEVLVIAVIDAPWPARYARLQHVTVLLLTQAAPWHTWQWADVAASDTDTA